MPAAWSQDDTLTFSECIIDSAIDALSVAEMSFRLRWCVTAISRSLRDGAVILISNITEAVIRCAVQHRKVAMQCSTPFWAQWLIYGGLKGMFHKACEG